MTGPAIRNDLRGAPVALSVRLLPLEHRQLDEFKDGALNSREAVGALACGEWEDGQLVYRCTIRSGFSERQQASLFRRLRERKNPGFLVAPRGWRWKGIRWCRPSLVASVRYLHGTANGKLRMTTFRGVGEDR